MKLNDLEVEKQSKILYLKFNKEKIKKLKEDFNNKSESKNTYYLKLDFQENKNKKLQSEYDKLLLKNKQLLKEKQENTIKLDKMEELRSNYNQQRLEYINSRNNNIGALRERMVRIQNLSSNLVNIISSNITNRNNNSNNNTDNNSNSNNNPNYEYLIEKFPSYEFSLDLIGTVINFDICLICFSNYEFNQRLVIIDSCKHPFHLTCWKNWFKINHKCPSCKLELLND